jgi:D-beta-D-heptose 7-phosphate kinase/D-beta-D-heptose 1-phosphate adenosyltransferase|tara:strand:- start:385 stop:870 length:486 start_codon:yes stop_codon:yes gene_type:complete
MQQKNRKLVLNLTDLISLCSQYKEDNKKIIMTNGCFDILHTGHVHILAESKKMGDVLIVALNSDKSINKLKGNNRPIMNQVDRSYILSNLESVDHIFIFNEETPERIICEILPDILVKGSDYKDKEVAGEDCLIKNNKKVVLVDLIDGKSSTNFINKILDS